VVEDPNANKPVPEKGAGQPEPEQKPTPTEMINISKEQYQKNLDELAGKIRAEEKAKQDKADKAKAEQARIASLEGEEKLKAEYASKEQAYNARIKELEHNAQLSRVQIALANAGVPGADVIAGNLVGADDADTDKKVKAYVDGFNSAVKTKVGGVIDKGAPGGTAQPQGNKTQAQGIADDILGKKKK